MGYTTDFYGTFKITPALKEEHKEYLLAFSDSRRMKRDAQKCESLHDPIRLAVELPVGIEGEFVVSQTGYDDKSIIERNSPSSTQPGLWCQWIPNDEGTELKWNGAEKFYAYIEWLDYLHTKLFKPWGYTLEGMVKWRGEDHDDTGRITFKDNILSHQTQKQRDDLLDEFLEKQETEKPSIDLKKRD